MKKLLFVLVTTFAVAACGNRSNKATTMADEGNDGDRIEILYFHGKKRCITCNAIESETKSLLENEYASELREGRIVYQSVDISKAENEKTAERYEVTWSSLFVNHWQDSEETSDNITGFAFQYAKNNPEQFRAGLRDRLNELLAR